MIQTKLSHILYHLVPPLPYPPNDQDHRAVPVGPKQHRRTRLPQHGASNRIGSTASHRLGGSQNGNDAFWLSVDGVEENEYLTIT